ncbi:hypothetical protein ACN47E_007217 [Coniothyrium glycines]
MPEKNLDPFEYTSGRWLRDDALERHCRNIEFDFDALCLKVIALCPGASSITSYRKKEGGFNRVFIFHTDNAKRVVARLPFSIAGPQRLATNSEVATIQYIQANTSIPIPKILAWSDDKSNAIGTEYIIMEHALGTSLHARWLTMNVEEQLGCIKAIFLNMKQLVDLDFSAYGSLYFEDTPNIATTKLPLDQDYVIGPHCGAMYWNCNARQPRYYHDVHPNRGPWLDLNAYYNGLVDTGISRLPPIGMSPQRPRYRGSVQTHRELLEQGREVMSKLALNSNVQHAAVPVLFHPDLHKRNIFVSEDDPTVISAIIDWQSSSIEPAFWYADERPDFAQPVSDASYEGSVEPKSEACAKAFDVSVQYLTPKLATARSMDEDLFRPFRYCYRTWEDGDVAFREELIQTSLHWRGLGLERPCPISIPQLHELEQHQKDYKRFEAAIQLRHILSSLLNTASDGWVPSEQWEATRTAHRELFVAMLQEILENEHPDDDEPVKSENDLRELWPFDLNI